MPVFTPDAPTPRGHYSQAVVANGTVYVAGLLPASPSDGKMLQAGVREQSAQIFQNLDAILLAAGSHRSKVVSLQVFLCDLTIWSEINEACANYFGEHKPARVAVPILPLRDGALLEINAIAVV